jgi:hypothetical protein
MTGEEHREGVELRVEYRALYERECDHDGTCWCEENDVGEMVYWDSETIIPPRGIHVEDCKDTQCQGCWVMELDGPMPLFWWMVEHLGAQGGAVVVNGEVVDSWSGFQ